MRIDELFSLPHIYPSNCSLENIHPPEYVSTENVPSNIFQFRVVLTCECSVPSGRDCSCES